VRGGSTFQTANVEPADGFTLGMKWIVSQIAPICANRTAAAFGGLDRRPSRFHVKCVNVRGVPITHRTTKVRRPQSNGFVERLHRTLLDEHFRVAGRTQWYESVDEMQKDLEAYLEKIKSRVRPSGTQHERPNTLPGLCRWNRQTGKGRELNEGGCLTSTRQGRLCQVNIILVQKKEK